MTLHGAVWVWGGTLIIALLALGLLFLLHGQATEALALFFGANLIGVFIWVLAARFRRSYPPDETSETDGATLRDKLHEEE